MVNHVEEPICLHWRTAIRIAMCIDLFNSQEWVNFILKHSESYKLFACYDEFINPLLQ